MKALIFAATLVMSLTGFAANTPIDRELETRVIENPTLENKYFCGVDGRIIDAAVFVCSSQGYSNAQILERVAVHTGALCWTVEPRGNSNYFELRQANAVLTKVKCSREKGVPPISKPEEPTPIPYP